MKKVTRTPSVTITTDAEIERLIQLIMARESSMGIKRTEICSASLRRGLRQFAADFGIPLED